MEHESITLIKRIYPLLGQKNHGELATVMSNLTWLEMIGGPYGGYYKGSEEINTHVFQPLAKEWQDFKFEAETYQQSEKYVIVIGNYSGVYKQSHKELFARAIHLWEIMDSDTIHFEQFTDTALFYRVMGI